MTGQPLLDISGLETEFRVEGGTLRAVKGVSLTVRRGETVALVGESGSGKSVTSLSVMRLIPERSARIAGRILFHGPEGEADLATLGPDAMSRIRGREIAMVFQEPMTSLNPAHRVGAQIAESLRVHEGLSRGAALKRAEELLALVEIPDPARRVHAWPHQLSGGMRQRVMIAMALACRPSLLIADEPTTALDTTVQLQILLLLKRLQAEFGMGVLFITHNLGVVAEIADRVLVMYGGRIVEEAPVADLLTAPRHPYTRGLLASVPRTDHAARARGDRARLAAIPGNVVDPRHPPDGCDFHPRCAFATAACRAAVPPLEPAGDARRVRCIRWSEIA